MKVLLCLLSDQHVPNLLSVHHYKPDQLVLVQSEAMRRKDVAQHFLAALKKGGEHYESRTYVQPLTSEDDLAQVRAALQESVARFPSGEWIANVTGGMKPMGIATYEFFKAAGGTIVYTNSSQPDRIVNLVTGHSESCDYRLSVDEFVTGYGFVPQKKPKALQAAKARAADARWTHTANLLAAQNTAHDVLNLDDTQRESIRQQGGELPAERFAFPSEELRASWLGDAASRTLTKYEGEFLTGGWLEVFFYNLLARHADRLAIWDVALGQNIDFGDKQDPSAVPNDFDVSFMHNQGMVMVECKSGTQLHAPGSGVDVLYKIAAVTAQLRALRVRSFLVTTGENVLDETGKVRGSIQSRANLYNCRILTRERIAELSGMVLTESPNTVNKVKELFGL